MLVGVRPNKRLKLTGVNRSKGSGVFVPWGTPKVASNEATAASFAGRFHALDCVVVHGHYRALSTARGTRTNKSVAVRSGCGSHLDPLRPSDRPASPRRILRHP